MLKAKRRPNQIANTLQQRLRLEGFQPKLHIEAFILVLGLQTTDHKDRNTRQDLPYLPGESVAAHARHDMVRDDQSNFRQEVPMSQLLKRAGRIESGDNKVSAAPQNRLSHSSLYRIVVYQKNRLFTWHLQLQGEKPVIVQSGRIFSRDINRLKRRKDVRQVRPP
jgi:hypothetical protein